MINITDSDCESMESEIPTMPPQAHETLRSRRRTRRPQRFGEYLIEESDDKNESGMNCSMAWILNHIFLSHLSRRLIGELIGYPWIRRPSSCVVVVRPSTFSNIFSSETAWPIKAKFYVEPPWVGGTKVCINGPGHMTKMAAMPIYGKNLKKSSSPEPAGRFPRNLVCSIGDSCPS